jgi:hypothetical protein
MPCDGATTLLDLIAPHDGGAGMRALRPQGSLQSSPFDQGA